MHLLGQIAQESVLIKSSAYLTVISYYLHYAVREVVCLRFCFSQVCPRITGTTFLLSWYQGHRHALEQG